MSLSGENNLKTKAFFITCPEHEGKNGKLNSSLETKRNLQNMGVEISKEKTFVKIQKEIVEPNYHGYASILFFIELECLHYKVKDLLNFVYEAIERNSTLKYVTKLIISYSYVEMSFGKLNWTVLLNSGKKHVKFKYPTIEKMRELFPNSSELNFETWTKIPASRIIKVLAHLPNFQKIYSDVLRKEIRRDVPFIDNLIFVESVQLGFTSKKTILETFFENLHGLAKRTSIQEIAQQCIVACDDPEYYHEVATYAFTGNGGCYIYNVNPALAIVINHRSFSSQLHLSFRDGSLKDVEALQKVFKAKKITSLTLNDGSLEDVQAIMRKVHTTNFMGIKNLFIVIMSHGDEGDIIYTKTDSYSIRDDIVAPLLANPTLAQVQKFVIVNACRGEVDPRFDDIEGVEKLRSSLAENNSMYPSDEKLMMIFSTQKGFISLLFDEGAIFVQLFCDIFLENFDEKSMEKISEELEELMMENIADDQIADFGITDGLTHNIRMEFVNFFNNYELLNDLAEFFKKHLKANLAILDGRSILREEQDRTLLGIGYIDGVDKHRLTNAQKESIEHFIETKQGNVMKGNKSWSALQVRYEWSMDRKSGRSRVCVLKKTV